MKSLSIQSLLFQISWIKLLFLSTDRGWQLPPTLPFYLSELVRNFTPHPPPPTFRYHAPTELIQQVAEAPVHASCNLLKCLGTVVRRRSKELPEW